MLEVVGGTEPGSAQPGVEAGAMDLDEGVLGGALNWEALGPNKYAPNGGTYGATPAAPADVAAWDAGGALGTTGGTMGGGPLIGLKK